MPFFHEKRNSEKNRRLQGIEAFVKWVYVCVWCRKALYGRRPHINMQGGLQEIRYQGGQKRKETLICMTSLIVKCQWGISLGKHSFLVLHTLSPSRTLDSARTFLPELRRNKDTVRCAVLGAEVPGHRQEQLTQTLIVCSLKTYFFFVVLNIGRAGPPLYDPRGSMHWMENMSIHILLQLWV